jgi:D-serine dehydratase
MTLGLKQILDSILDGRTKGFPQGQPPLRLSDVGRQGWRLCAGDLDTPVALLRASALDANAAWMREFLRRTGASLCPHGKTSMAPQLFHRQLAEGAWGITLATPQQVRVAHAYGVKRILLANELVAEAAIAWVQRLLDEDPAFDFTCLVDSLDAVRRLEASARGRRPFAVLLERGVPGGRTGARDEAAALAVARAVKASGQLCLRGVECFEGIVGTPDPAADRAEVERWLEGVASLARRCADEDLFQADEVLLSAGGSAYFDLVARQLAAVDLGRPTRVLLRSGCYAFHDAGHYARLVSRLEERLPPEWRAPGHLTPAIEIWGRVLSRPEAGLAFLDFGKRDVAHDLDLPRPILWARPGVQSNPVAVSEGWSVASLYDQHARLRLPADAALAVGDLVGCGISHPCTTLDKWQLLFVVDDGYRVTEAIRTFF